MQLPTHIQRSTLTLALLGVLTTPVFAADTTSSAQPDTMTVLGKAYRNTATKSALEPEETPQGITVIDEEQLEQRGVQSLNQALRYAPGVVTETKGAAVTMYDTFTIRGFAVNQSYYDGLVLQTLKGWNLQPQIDPIMLQQVEVFKGPTSVLYGAMPPGGMVNMIAKTPQQSSETKIGVATGSRNLMEASVDSTGQLGDSDLSYRLIALARKQDGQVNHTEEERYVIAPSLDWQVNDRTLINVNLYYQNDPSMGMNSSLPASGMLVRNPNGSTSPSTFAGDTAWSKFEREVLMLGYKVNHDFNANWSFLQNFRYSDASLTQHNTYHTAANFDSASGTLVRNIYSTEEESTDYVVDNQLSGRFTTGAVQHNLLLGVDYQKLDGESDYKEYATSDSAFYAFNVFQPNNHLLSSGSLSEVYRMQDDVSSEQTGFYFQDQLRWNQWVLIAGGRYDRFESESFGQKADDNQFSYRVGALYAFSNGVAPYLSYATSFEPVAGVSQFGRAFSPETAEQIEAGIKYQSPQREVEATASLFHITKKDVVITDPSSANYQSDLQVGEAVSQGVELQGRWFINANADISASYTYTDMEITEDSDNGLEGTTPIYVPKNMANIWGNYYVYNGLLNGSRLSLGARYVGEMQMDATNTQGKVPSYTVVDASLGYDLGALSDSLHGVTANLIANNVFNEEYSTCYDQANCWYGAERSVELSVKYAF